MIKRVFFVGIKGVGMTSLAVLLKEAGMKVYGSDTDEIFITDDVLNIHSIHPSVGFELPDIDTFLAEGPHNEALVIVSAAHGGFDNPQAVYAKNLKLRILSYALALGECMNGTLINKEHIRGISIAGAHGKTTISSWIATVLYLLSYDPSYVIGTSSIYPIGEGGHYGKGDFFIAEADEYLSDSTYDRKPKFLYQFPEIAIINNIDFDHPDFFANFDSVLNAYSSFIANVKDDGVLIVNGDDKNIKKLMIQNSKKHTYITYGEESHNDIILKSFTQTKEGSSFQVTSSKGVEGEFSISLFGRHNALNALAVIALLHLLDTPVSKIQEVLPLFKGSRRRLEYIGRTKEGIDVIDDYAHHPDEVKKSLSALQGVYKNKKIICIFQSHTYSRTQALLEEFASAFEGIFHLILLPTFSSAREQKELHDPASILKDELVKRGSWVVLLPNKSSVLEYVTGHFTSPDYLIVTMGAGDVYKIAEEIVKEK